MAVCAGDPFCLYDGLVTGNVSVAAITMDMVTESRRVRELSVGGELGHDSGHICTIILCIVVYM